MTPAERLTALLTEGTATARATVEEPLTRALVRVVYALTRAVTEDLTASTPDTLRAAVVDGWEPATALQAARRRLEEEWEAKADDGTFRLRLSAAELTAAPALQAFAVAFNVASPLLKDAARGLSNRTNLTAPVWDLITSVLQTTLDEGLAPREAARAMTTRVTTADPGQTSLGRARSLLIARTELTRIANAASIETATLTGAATGKMWIARLDDRVRPTHAAANGQTVPIGEPFTVGMAQGMYPGDPNLPAWETARCRCTLGYV